MIHNQVTNIYQFKFPIYIILSKAYTIDDKKKFNNEK